jgi:hypothetical protein
MIYVFKVNGFNHYKIGIAKSVTRRFKEVDRYNPFGIECLKTYQTNYDRGVETKIHHRFEDRLIKNEWYEIDYNPIDEIDEIVSLNNTKFNHRTYLRKKQDNGSMVELAKRVVELYDKHYMGRGKRNDLINKTKGKYQRAEFIVSSELNISTSKVYRLRY